MLEQASCPLIALAAQQAGPYELLPVPVTIASPSVAFYLVTPQMVCRCRIVRPELNVAVVPVRADEGEVPAPLRLRRGRLSVDHNGV